jgi:catechol 2,3-dioxygenase-like lactoylglutathione lyase family enzyme
MFDKLSVLPTLPAKNIDRAKKFYADKLGLQPDEVMPTGEVIFKVNKSSLLLYTSQYAGTAKNTAATFETDNLERDMRDLRNKGVVFEDYDMGDLKTVNGVASVGDIKSAWFKDTEGNIIALTERTHR